MPFSLHYLLTYTHNHCMALCLGPPGWASTRRNIHPLILSWSLSAFSIYCDPSHPPCSIYVLDSPFAQPLSKSFLVYLLVWRSALHTPYISPPSHCLLFATLAHTNTACFAVVPRLCHLILVSLYFLLGTLSFTLMSHIHLTILWPAEVPPHFLFWQARSHLHAMYYFTCNCYTVSLSLSMICLCW